jgi:hypothetical protein
LTTFRPPTPELLSIQGPEGLIEAVLEAPPGPVRAVAVVCHPHPLHGGTMHNKVVHMLARTFHEQGVTTLRFNYRGVGQSGGQYDEGRGETEDALAALDFLAARAPEAPLWLAGFSFGGAVAFRASSRRPVERLVLVAPAVQRVAATGIVMPACPWLIVQGDQDEVIDPGVVADWVATLPSAPDLVMLAGVGHYFHGRLDDLRSTVRGWLAAQER